MDGGRVQVTWQDVRRLTGRSYLLDRSGAAGELVFDPPLRITESQLEALRQTVIDAFVLCEIPFSGPRLLADGRGTGLTVAVGAPLDQLEAACDCLEEALRVVADRFEGVENHLSKRVLARVAADALEERLPALAPLLGEAIARGIPTLFDDERLTVGLGVHSVSYAIEQLPLVAEVPWDTCGTIPAALVTGTNGKTTTARMLHRILRGTGRCAALTSTVGIYIDDRLLDEGDWSGPGGARTVLRDSSVELAVLETARGGLLRRGLAFSGYAVAVLTNINDDHYGDYGIHDRAAMAAVKAVVGHGVAPDGVVVINGDDPLLMEQSFEARRVLFAITESPLVTSHLATGGVAFVSEDGQLVRRCADFTTPIVPIEDVPLTFGGDAPFNIMNALAAAAAADAMGIGLPTIAAGLKALHATPKDLPGRSNVLIRGEQQVVLDFAHNPASVAAALRFATRSFPGPLTVSLGMPGDRSDEDLHAVVDAITPFLPHSVVVRELDSVRRGREPSEVPNLLRSRFLQAGVRSVTTARNDVDAAIACSHATEGTVVMLAVIDLHNVVDTLTQAGFHLPV